MWQLSVQNESYNVPNNIGRPCPTSPDLLQTQFFLFVGVQRSELKVAINTSWCCKKWPPRCLTSSIKDSTPLNTILKALSYYHFASLSRFRQGASSGLDFLLSAEDKTNFGHQKFWSPKVCLKNHLKKNYKLPVKLNSSFFIWLAVHPRRNRTRDFILTLTFHYKTGEPSDSKINPSIWNITACTII